MPFNILFVGGVFPGARPVLFDGLRMTFPKDIASASVYESIQEANNAIRLYLEHVNPTRRGQTLYEYTFASFEVIPVE